MMLPNERYERQLGRWWTRMNREVFGGALLASPQLLIDRTLDVNALWGAQQSTLRLSHRFVRASSWWAVLETLKQEMARQYVSDVIGARDERARQEAHRMLCDRLGLCAAPTHQGRDAASSPLLENIKALLGRGDSTADRAALSLAKRLAQTPSIPVVEGSERFSAHAVGPVSTVEEPHERRVASVLVRVLGVECVWVDSLDASGHGGRQLEVIGRLQHVRAAERLRALLLEEAGRRWTKRASRGPESWLDFLDRAVEGFERVVPDDCDGYGSSQAREVELMEFCSRRHRNLRSSD